MADLVVDGSGLSRLVSTLNSAADSMHEATGALSGAGTRGLGHSDLESAADHFADEWGYGIGQLHKASTNVAKQLDEGIRTYAESDAELGEQIRKAMKKQ